MEPDGSGRPELLPQLLAELQGTLQAVLATRDRMRGLLEAVVAISSGLDLESTLRRIVENAVELVDATYGALQARDAGSQPDPRAGIVDLVEEMTSVLGFAPSLRLGAGLRTLNSEELTEQALALLREALSNVARHAGASRADVTVDVGQDGILSVTVTDNGTGIRTGGRRSGLRNLAERAAKLGGELRLGQAEPAAPRPGTGLEWRVPVPPVAGSGPDGQRP